MELDEEIGMKLEINNFLWMYSPRHLCMKHAETLACAMLSLMRDAAARYPQDEWEPLEVPRYTTFRVRNARAAECATLRGLCYSFRTHFDIHWDDGTHVMDVVELSALHIFKEPETES